MRETQFAIFEKSMNYLRVWKEKKERNKRKRVKEVVERKKKKM